MGEKTAISWTDHTFNPWWICTEVSPGCDNCYARTFARRLGYEWGKGVPRRAFGEKHWNEPRKWNAKAEQAGEKRKVFCASMADVMDDEAPAGERDRLWELIDSTPFLIWQLLTKRPQRYGRYLPAMFRHGNVQFGTTTENQEQFNIRWKYVSEVALEYRAIGWISYEPALGPLTMQYEPPALRPEWVVFGGESGSGFRPTEQRWAEAMLAECRKYNVAFFMKQMAAQTPQRGKELIPAHLRVQEFPLMPY